MSRNIGFGGIFAARGREIIRTNITKTTSSAKKVVGHSNKKKKTVSRTVKDGNKKRKRESGNQRVLSLDLAGERVIVAPSIKIRELKNKKNKLRRKNKTKVQKKKVKKSDTPQRVGLLPR